MKFNYLPNIIAYYLPKMLEIERLEAITAICFTRFYIRHTLSNFFPTNGWIFPHHLIGVINSPPKNMKWLMDPCEKGFGKKILAYSWVDFHWCTKSYPLSTGLVCYFVSYSPQFECGRTYCSSLPTLPTISWISGTKVAPLGIEHFNIPSKAPPPWY